MATLLETATARYRKRRPTTAQKYDQASDYAGQHAQEAQAAYRTRADSFDAGKSVADWARGAHGMHMVDLSEAIDRLRGEQAGMGRLNTGYATQDEDYLVRDMNRDFNNQLLQTSVQGAGIQAGHIAGMGSYGASMAGLHGDFLSGKLDREAAERERRRKKRSSLLGGLGAVGGAVVGTALGNPVLGAQLGGYLGSAIGG